MSLNSALTEYVKTEKFFVWIIDNVDLITSKSLRNDQNNSSFPMYLESPTMTAIDPITNVAYNGKLRLKFNSFPSDPTLSLQCSPADGSFEVCCQYDGEEEFALKDTYPVITLEGVKRIVISVNHITVRTQKFQSASLEIDEGEKLVDRLKKMWKNDSSTHFTIKCGETEITAIKPILAASSPVFNTMFENDMKEAEENCMEIKEFDTKIVEKMIEFCENDSIEELEECEEGIFKIAHKYQMTDLMKYSIAKMSNTISTSNIESRIQLTNLYELKDFKKWCMQFAFRNNIEVDF